MKEKFMRYLRPDYVSSGTITRNVRLASTALLIVCAIGCGGGNNNSGTTPPPPAPPTQGPQTYFAPFVAGMTNGTASGPSTTLNGPIIYAIDDFADTFSQSTFQLKLPQQQGPQVINTGVAAAGQRGLLSLGITTNYIPNSSTRVFDAINYNPPKTGSFALELAGQAGGLIQLVGQPVDPLVAAVQCPSLSTAQTYQFLTIPGSLINSSSAGQIAGFWDPTTDTAYGSVDISTNGSNVSFNNIHQFTLPTVGGSGSPTQQPTSPVGGACGLTVFGNTISVGQLTVTNPGAPGSNSNPTHASLGIGPTGLLVEHNGSGNGTFPGTSSVLPYDNTLGAGTGAVGLPRPSSAVDTGALLGAQYLGFVYGAGAYHGDATTATGWSSHLTSFGFSNTPSSCSSFAAQTGPLANGIYGGDFPQNNGQDNPSASTDGFGNCDLAIDLGVQDSSNNGLYPRATVWIGGSVGSSYVSNTMGKTYSFPAVAIAGQLNGKNAIFVLGVDSTQPWAVYLLQSN